MKQKTKNSIIKFNQFAKDLNLDLPKSEKWFQWFWKKNGFEHPLDRYNWPSRGLIPDVINHKFKYVIEIDGSIHNAIDQIQKDKRKDRIYKSRGYQIFRVKAYNESEAMLAGKWAAQIRKKRTSYEDYLGTVV